MVSLFLMERQLFTATHVSDDSVNYIINDFGDGTGEIVPLDANDDNPDFNNAVPITSSFAMSNYNGMETGNIIQRQLTMVSWLNTTSQFQIKTIFISEIQ